MHAQQVLGDIYAAIDDDEALAHLSSSVSKLCGGRSANILYLRRDAEPFQQFSYFPAEYVPLYFEHFLDKDPWRRAAQKLGYTARAVSMDEHVSPQQFVETEFYNELLKPIGDDTGRCMGMERLTDDGSLHIAVHRPLGGRGFDQSDLMRMEEAFVHVARVLRMRSLLSLERSYRRSLEQMIDAANVAALVIDESLAIVTMSEPARALLNGNDGLSFREGRLEIADQALARALRAAVRRLARRDGALDPAFLCPRRSAKPHYRLRLLPAGASASAVLLIDDPAADAQPTRLQSFSRAYGLTASEMRLAECLLEGLSLRDIADRREVSIETVRTQLKSIFTKTGAHRQAEVVRLLS